MFNNNLKNSLENESKSFLFSLFGNTSMQSLHHKTSLSKEDLIVKYYKIILIIASLQIHAFSYQMPSNCLWDNAMTDEVTSSREEFALK